MNLNGTRILITGGTGSCGHQLTHRLLQGKDGKPKEIVIFSRDEKKHFDMKYEMREHPEVRFMLGDVRDYERVAEAMKGIDIVFHTAAMKHVWLCEENPTEAFKTNVLGTTNVINAAIESNVPRVVCLSTDKAVEPVNVMGMTKALAERIVTDAHFSSRNTATKACCVRYGNVMNSRGSVIPFFRSLIAAGKPLTITNEKMTRFLLTLGDAIDLVFFAAETMEGGEIFVKKAPAVHIKDLAEVMCREKGTPFDYKIIGMFPGEKINEVLVSESEKTRALDKGSYFVIRPGAAESTKIGETREYCSADEIVKKDEIARLLTRADAEYRESHQEQDVYRAR